MSLVKHLRAVLVLPFMVTIVIPATIVYFTSDRSQSVFSFTGHRTFTTVAGVALLLIGLLLVVMTNWLFATIGKGTLAPWDPTQKLVVRGVYRHVRNPMISGVMFILLGESLLLSSLAVGVWFLVFLTANAVFIPFLEEPDLRRRFGDEYDVYRKNVPRWIPRLRPWTLP